MPERVAHETAGGGRRPGKKSFGNVKSVVGVESLLRVLTQPISSRESAQPLSRSCFGAWAQCVRLCVKIYLSDAAAVPWRAELSSEQSPSSHARNKLPFQTDAGCLRCCCGSSAPPPPPPPKNWSCEVKKVVAPSVRPSVRLHRVSCAEERCWTKLREDFPPQVRGFSEMFCDQ